MNKKLLAVAIAGAFAAPVAMADTSNVVIFGKIQAEAGSFNNGTASGTGSTTGGSNSYRKAFVNSSQNTELGFKGTEDLGNGLSAVWQVAVDVRVDGSDTTFNSTTASTSGQNFGSRNTYVGVASKTMGTVILGKHDTPYKTSTGPLDLFTGTIADYNTLMGSNGYTVGSTTGLATTITTFDARPGNVVMYSSPKFNGFDVKAAWSAVNEGNVTPNGTSVTNKGNLWSLSLNYANGPIFATAAHEENEGARSNIATATTVGYASTTTAVKGKATKLGFGYNFGATKVGLIWERIKDNANASAAASSYSAFANTNSRDRKAWYLGAAHSIGKVTLKGAYNKMGDMDGLTESGAKQWTLGADYALSKRTSVYALYTKMNNEQNAAYSLGQGGTSMGTNVMGTASAGVADARGGADPKAFAVGMVHTF